MKNKRYQIAVICVMLLSLLSVVWGCGRQEEDNGEAENAKSATQIVFTTGFEKNEVFRIGKSSCYQDEFMVYLTNIQNRYESVYGSQIWSVSGNGISMESRLKDMVAARIAQVKTMNLLADEYQVTLTEDEEKLVQQAAKEYYDSLNDAEIQAMGASQELIAQIYREYALAHKVYDYIIRDINPEISDDEARNVIVDWIFLRSSEEDETIMAQAEEIRARLDDGEDFDSLASAYSDDKVITHTFGKGSVDENVEDCAFNLSVGEISQVIKGEDGYYILRCVSTLDRKETDANKEKIVTQRKKEAFNKVYGDFTEGQVKQLNESLWEKISMIHQPDVTTSDFFDIYEQYFIEE
jgi:foldase protein PrsA